MALQIQLFKTLHLTPDCLITYTANKIWSITTMILASFSYNHPSEKNRYLKVIRVSPLACSHVWYIQGCSDIETSERDEKPFNASLTRSNNRTWKWSDTTKLWHHKYMDDGLETQRLSQEVGFEHDARRRLGRFTGGGVVPGGFSL